ncbi:MAG: hypothetical protein GY755_07535 [Chloroflexi bacterium]|nr:hypothetical protein [Chloroflexota bacterium]
MSKVYSFRLDEKNPREAQAMRIIEAWVEEGFSLRHQLVNMIVSSKDGGSEYSELLRQIEHLLSNSERSQEVSDADRRELSDDFLGSLKMSVKDGYRSISSTPSSTDKA